MNLNDSNQLTVGEFCETLYDFVLEDTDLNCVEVVVSAYDHYLTPAKPCSFHDGSIGMVFGRGGDDLCTLGSLIDYCVGLENQESRVFVMTEDGLSVEPVVGAFWRKDGTVEVVLR